MASNIERMNNNNDADNQPTLEIGGRGNLISPKIYQSIYNHITGRTEKTSQTYEDNILVSFNELEQLHLKILQIKDIHNVLAQNETISLFFSGERREVFTSFERFEKYNSNNTKPTKSLQLKYNFSLLLAGTSVPQEYVVTIKLVSRFASIQAFEEKKNRLLPSGLVNILVSNTADITIEYVDYLVAKTYLQAFDEWIKGCPCEQESRFTSLLQSFSHYVPRIIQLIIIAICLYYYNIYISTLSESFNKDWGRFFLFSLVSIFVLTKIAFIVGEKIERYIDSFKQDSYLNLNNGDKKLIKEFASRKKATYTKIIFQLVMTVVLGIISSKLSLLF